MTRRTLVIGLLALAVGLLLGLALDRTAPSEVPPRTNASDAGAVPRHPAAELPGLAERDDPLLDGLAAALDAEVAERERLAAELETVERRLNALEADLAARVRMAFEDEQPQIATDQSFEQVEVAPEQQVLDRRKAMIDQLAAGGFRRTEAERIAGEADRIAFQAIDEYDRAVREGRPDAAAQFSGHQRRLQAAIGDAAYDRYLYAMGMPNRMSVHYVMRDSPAERAGLRAGDRLLSYAGERVFSAEALGDLTHEGTRGETVALEIERNGQRLTLYAPRGPLGINAAPTDHVEPEG